MNDLRRDGMMKNQRFEVILWTCLWYDDFQANMVAFDGKISSALNKYYARGDESCCGEKSRKEYGRAAFETHQMT